MDKFTQFARAVLSRIQAFLKNLGQKTKNLWKKTTPPGNTDDRGDKPRAVKTSDQASSYKREKVIPIRRNSKERVYRLKGYTTVDKVNRKRQSESQQRFLRSLLVFIIFILIVIVLFNIYNPFKDLSEFQKILGVDKISDLISSKTTAVTTTATTTAETTLDPSATTSVT